MAMLLKRQKPCEPSGSLALVQVPSGPAWRPGGGSHHAIPGF